MSSPSDVLRVAASQLGVREDPDGSNLTPYSRWYGLQGAWCAMFVSWVMVHTATPIGPGAKGAAWCSSMSEWFRQHGRLTIGTAGIRAGDVVFFEWGTTPGGYDHVGLVEQVLGDGTVITLEGNVGNRVQRLRRSLTSGGIHSYGRPAYTARPTPPPPPPPAGPAPSPRLKAFRPPETRALRLGDEGRDVAELQFLGNLVVSRRVAGSLPPERVQVVVDGKFGPLTQRLVEVIQHRTDLAVDGVAGAATRRAIERKLVELGWWR